MNIRISRISTDAEVQALAPDWLRLHDESQSANPFNHPTWILTWWHERRQLGLRWNLYSVLDLDGHLIGVLPLVRDVTGVVRFAGHDLHDVAAGLVSQDDRAAMWRLATDDLVHGDSETLDLPTLGDDDLASLRTAGGGNGLQMYDVDPGARIRLPTTWDEYWMSLPTKRRKRMRAERRALERDHGPIGVDVVDHADHAGRAMEEFWALRESSWRQRGRYEDLAAHVRGVAMRSFLTELAARSAGSQFVAVVRLTAGRHLLGSALLLRSAGRAWYSMCAFAPEFGRYGPGRLLLAECVRAAIGERLTCLELGRGVEPYKFALGAVRYELSNVRLALHR